MSGHKSRFAILTIMSDTIYFKKYVEKGLCGSCGKPRGEDGTTYLCRKCADKKNAYSKETREWLLSYGYCPTCGKEKLMGDERKCVLCRAREAELQQQARERNRDAYNKYARENSQKRRDFRRENGLCTKCGAELKDDKYKRCERCRAKGRKEKKNYTDKKNGYSQNIQKLRLENGICRCGKAPFWDNHKLCKECYEKQIDVLKKARESGNLSTEHWNKGNKMIFYK